MELFGHTYVKGQTEQNAINDFTVTGIYSFNKNIFIEADFLATQIEAQNACSNCVHTDTQQNIPGLSRISIEFSVTHFTSR